MEQSTVRSHILNYEHSIERQLCPRKALHPLEEEPFAQSQISLPTLTTACFARA